MKIATDEDALKLEQIDKMFRRNARIRRAINQTYSEKKPTKKRHKLSGKRKWKNKELQYRQVQADMLVAEYNAKNESRTIIKRMVKKRKKHDLV